MSATSRGDEPSTGSAAVAKVFPLTRPSERVQAQLFAKMLRREIATMKRKVTNAETAWQRRCESEGYVDPPQRLSVLRERIAEARRMLKALSARFPRTTYAD
jgi:hypothetical protein